MNEPLNIVFIGLSLSSSWGNGHATTYRSLLSGLNELGHHALFLERDKPWYADNRDLPDPDFCELRFYDSVDELVQRFGAKIACADAVIVGSFVPDGIRIIDRLRPITKRLCFYDIDTPVTLARLREGDEDYIAARQLPDLDIYFSFTGGPLLDRLEQEFGVPEAAALYCSVEADAYFPTGAEKTWDLGYLGTYSEDRQPGLERLLLDPARRHPEMRFVVAGSQYPDGIDWPENVERIDHLAPEHHAAFYSKQRFTLNVTRTEMVKTGWAPSVRLFEAAACGTPIISDPWEGLTDLLPKDEAILIAETSEQAEAALTTLPAERAASIGAAARDIVLAAHTGTARAASLADHIRSARSNSARPEADRPAWASPPLRVSRTEHSSGTRNEGHGAE